jgi:hypothetical protein
MCSGVFRAPKLAQRVLGGQRGVGGEPKRTELFAKADQNSPRVCG